MSTNHVKVTQLQSNLLQYQIIEHFDRVSYYTSAYLFVSEGEGVLIDTGTYEMGKFIKEDLEKRKIQLKYIILSHYHKDHAMGSLAFKNIPIVVGSEYELNQIKCTQLIESDLKFEEPQVIVEDKETLIFRDSKLNIYKTPGHTPCGISIIIDSQYIFVGDLILEDLDNKVIIPYIDKDANPKDHLKSLRLLEQFESHHLMLSHGRPHFNIEISRFLADPIYYLERFIGSNYDGGLDYCLMGQKEDYAMCAIHKINKRNAKKMFNLK
jgi:glyoxylase-like metal-dependent hydrolase (beta-lactamase superfamily II)